MEYVNLGKTGLKVSRLCLGCMTYGSSKWREWVLNEEESRPFFKRAIEAGINFFDTANIYSDGVSEEVTGELCGFRQARRTGDCHQGLQSHAPDANGRGLSRKAIMTEIDHSLRRLGTDYVDLYQIHRWDYATPIAETMEALHDVVKAGKARYIGGSSMFAWQFAQSLHVSETNGWTKFVSMQNHYNLIYREEEREMNPFCRDQGVGLIPWSPLARGFLAGNRINQAGPLRVLRPTNMRRTCITRTTTSLLPIALASRESARLAEHASGSRVVVAKPGISAIIGASKMPELEDASGDVVEVK